MLWFCLVAVGRPSTSGATSTGIVRPKKPRLNENSPSRTSWDLIFMMVRSKFTRSKNRTRYLHMLQITSILLKTEEEERTKLLSGLQLMTANHKEQLQIQRPKLIQNMNPTEVINELLSHQLLTPREADDITRAGGTDAQNEKLLDCLHRKPDCAYGKFCDALRATKQEHLEQLLRCDVLTVSD